MGRKKKTDRFTHIKYNVRSALNISCNEYCFCDIVFCLSGNPDSDGWADAKLDYYAACIGVGKRGVEKIRDRMCERGFLVKKIGCNNNLKITKKWYSAAQEGSVETISITMKKSKPNKKPTTNKVHTLKILPPFKKTNLVHCSPPLNHELSSINHELSSINHELSSKHTYISIITDNYINNKGIFSKNNIADYDEQKKLFEILENEKNKNQKCEECGGGSEFDFYKKKKYCLECIEYKKQEKYIPENPKQDDWSLVANMKNEFNEFQSKLHGHKTFIPLRWVYRNGHPNKNAINAIYSLIMKIQDSLESLKKPNNDRSVFEFWKFILNQILKNKNLKWIRSGCTPKSIDSLFDNIINSVSYDSKDNSNQVVTSDTIKKVIELRRAERMQQNGG